MFTYVRNKENGGRFALPYPWILGPAPLVRCIYQSTARNCKLQISLLYYCYIFFSGIVPGNIEEFGERYALTAADALKKFEGFQYDRRKAKREVINLFSFYIKHPYICIYTEP